MFSVSGFSVSLLEDAGGRSGVCCCCRLPNLVIWSPFHWERMCCTSCCGGCCVSLGWEVAVTWLVGEYEAAVS